ncbi:unnamed protein product [Jaminaea pallidilutea]
MKLAIIAAILPALASQCLAFDAGSFKGAEAAIEQATPQDVKVVQDKVLAHANGAAKMIRKRRNSSCDSSDDDAEDDKKSEKHSSRSPKNSSSGAQFKAVSSSLPQGAHKYSDKIQVTWYGAHDLLNPSCGTDGWNPTDSSFIGAVGQWSGGPSCGDYVNICRTSNGNKCITIRVVDSCAGCDSNHIDLTKESFKALAGDGGLDVGVVQDLSLYKADTPSNAEKWMFGPTKLSQ